MQALGLGLDWLGDLGGTEGVIGLQALESNVASTSFLDAPGLGWPMVGPLVPQSALASWPPLPTVALAGATGGVPTRLGSWARSLITHLSQVNLDLSGKPFANTMTWHGPPKYRFFELYFELKAAPSKKASIAS